MIVLYKTIIILFSLNSICVINKLGVTCQKWQLNTLCSS